MRILAPLGPIDQTRHSVTRTADAHRGLATPRLGIGIENVEGRTCPTGKQLILSAKRRRTMNTDADEKPRFFSCADEFRRWLESNHHRDTVLWVGYHKVGSGRPSMTWNESVDQALCFGWIDGKRKSVDETSYKIRFTPRRRNSIWSDKNIRRMEELIQNGCVHPSGMVAYQRRSDSRSGTYSYEQPEVRLSPDQLDALKADKSGWRYFQSLPDSARRASIWWVVSAKRPETRARRFEKLLDCCRNECRIPPLTLKPRKKK